MRIWLAYKAHAEGAADPFTSLLPVGLISIQGVLRDAGYDARLVNLSRLAHEEIVSLLKADQPAIVGLSQFTHNRHETIACARLVKKLVPGCFVVLGGPHATHRCREILDSAPEVDAIVVGEGESAMLDLVRCVAGGFEGMERLAGIAFRQGDAVLTTPERPALVDLDSLILNPAYLDDAVGVDPRRQLEFIVTSRGCPGRCRFCSSPHFWGKRLRFRSPDAIIAEIRTLRDRYGLIYFSIRDDTFTADRYRVREFCRMLLEERLFILWNCQSRVNSVDPEMLGWMKRAGCECIQFGIESGSPRMLSALGKQITPEQVRGAALAVRQVGMNLSVYLIAGIPGEEETDLQETIGLISEIRPHDGQVSPLVYYPGTALFADAVNKGLVAADLFERELGDACLVRHDRFPDRSARQQLAALSRSGELNGYVRSDFARQKETLGYCHATNLLAGEYFDRTGKQGLAEREYREIVSLEPDNPWGWLALGEFYGQAGRLAQARQAFVQLCRTVPNHAPGYSALGEIFRLEGNEREAIRQYRLALELDPFDAAAQTALARG
ncbi:MAG: radical SAM protein [Geobacter sp.]|nr:radical SAM protein [Geobacter sp.]